MIKECTLECEERIRAERTLHEKKIADFEQKIVQFQRETSRAKAAEERAQRQEQRLSIQLQSERENSGITRLEEEVQNLRLKSDSFERLNNASQETIAELRAELTKLKLEMEREACLRIQGKDDSRIEVTKLKQENVRLSEQNIALSDQVIEKDIVIKDLKDNEGLVMSQNLAEQAKKIEHTRSEAQHWKSQHDVLIDQHKIFTAQLQQLLHKERTLNSKYRAELQTQSTLYEQKLRKCSLEYKQYKAKTRMGYT